MTPVFRAVLEIGAFHAAPDDMTRFGVLACLAETVIAANRFFLHSRAGFPGIYDAPGHLIYIERPDVWSDIPMVIAAGGGDCKDLCAWRIAQLREAGEDARLDIVLTRDRERKEGRPEYHMRVARKSGAIEDPSKFCGMR